MKTTTLLVALMLSLFVKANDTIVNLHLIPKIENGFYLHDEWHFQASENIISSQLLKFYITERNVTNITIEVGHATAYIANQYLQNGDEKLLCKMVFCKTDNHFIHKLKSLKKLKQNYNKIQFIGIDVYNFQSDWVYAINDLLHKMEFQNDSTQYFIGTMEPILEYYSKLSTKNFKTLNSDVAKPEKIYAIKRVFKKYFIKNEQIFKTSLNLKDYHTLKYIIESDRDFHNNHKDERNKHTNQHWYQNLHQYIDLGLVSKGNYYGKFGALHIRYSNVGRRTFTKFLNENRNSKFFNKVILCNSAYLNSYRRAEANPVFNENNNYTYVYPEEERAKLRGYSYWFQQGRLRTQEKYEIVQRRRKKFLASFILYIRDDEPAPESRKFCGDEGW